MVELRGVQAGCCGPYFRGFATGKLGTAMLLTLARGAEACRAGISGTGQSRLVTLACAQHPWPRRRRCRVGEAGNSPRPVLGAWSHLLDVRADAHHADQLQQVLQAAGVRVWRDTADIRPGDDWRMMIRRAILDNALVFLACFSRNSLARLRSYQNEELTLAIDQLRQRRPGEPWLIPVRFDDCEIPDIDIGGGRSFGSIQRADLSGDRFDEGAAAGTRRSGAADSPTSCGH